MKHFVHGYILAVLVMPFLTWHALDTYHHYQEKWARQKHEAKMEARQKAFEERVRINNEARRAKP